MFQGACIGPKSGIPHQRGFDLCEPHQMNFQKVNQKSRKILLISIPTYDAYVVHELWNRIQGTG